jgi:hypothetical protein
MTNPLQDGESRHAHGHELQQRTPISGGALPTRGMALDTLAAAAACPHLVLPYDWNDRTNKFLPPSSQSSSSSSGRTGTWRAAEDACKGRQRGESRAEVELCESLRSKCWLSSLKTWKRFRKKFGVGGMEAASASHLTEVKLVRHSTEWEFQATRLTSEAVINPSIQQANWFASACGVI